MKYFILIVSIIIGSCQSKGPQERPSDDWLTKYSRQSFRTDPGGYAALYNGLPQSLDSLCELIKCQLIHPLEARQMNLQIEGMSQDGITPTVKDILEKLISLDSAGLIYNRKTSDRLVVACYHHAMLLASILRSKGIPVRLRAGFSKYFEDKYKIRFGHIICEVWDKKSGKWILVDPDRKVVDLSYDDFDFAYEAWNNVSKKKKDPRIYTSSISDGIKGIVNLMILDASLIIRDEKLYWDLPVIVLNEIKDIKDIDDDAVQILNRLAEYCDAPDVKINDILDIYSKTEYFKSAGITYDEYVEMIMRRE